MHRRLLLAAPALLARPARAATAAQPRAVLELFTSQSCSSCPAADAVLREIVARQPEVLALSWHVTYWNRLGWRDPLSLEAATARQRRYAASLGLSTVYTPQAVVQGRADVLGSDRANLAFALAAAGRLPPATALGVVAGAEEVRISAGSGHGEGELLLLGFDALHVTAIGGGENGGRTLSHAHAVRSVSSLGPWRGAALERVVPRGEGEFAALLLQAPDGRILAAART